jgi:hypothetical protein
MLHLVDLVIFEELFENQFLFFYLWVRYSLLGIIDFFLKFLYSEGSVEQNPFQSLPAQLNRSVNDS